MTRFHSCIKLSDKAGCYDNQLCCLKRDHTLSLFFPQASKGRGQGLTNSTLFTSQGLTTIPKNSIDLEKENKQTNPSAHASTNLVPYFPDVAHHSSPKSNHFFSPFHVFIFGGGVKAKDLKGGTSSKAELLSELRSTRDDNKFLNEENKSLNEENKSLNEENKSLNDRLSTLEDEMKQIMKMKNSLLLNNQMSHLLNDNCFFANQIFTIRLRHSSVGLNFLVVDVEVAHNSHTRHSLHSTYLGPD
ncbi:hypothetical protein KY284_030419 [Solanum tuberosum]|nr:hypothetical protein KY284_030419 [Solanum tuberosum]